jgi:hypothetical protein
MIDFTNPFGDALFTPSYPTVITHHITGPSMGSSSVTIVCMHTPMKRID